MSGGPMNGTHPPLYHARKVTFDEYLRLKYDGYQYEIVEGVMRMSPAPFDEHQRLIGCLYFELECYVRKNPLGIVRIAPRDVKLAENLIYQPDILFISKERLAINKKKYVDGAPDFIIEILSQGTLSYDTREKFSAYEKYGVREYWIINPDNMEISEFFILKDGQYENFGPQENILTSRVITGFELDLTRLER
jgi:Uma2 family endonuclease